MCPNWCLKTTAGKMVLHKLKKIILDVILKPIRALTHMNKDGFAAVGREAFLVEFLII